MHNVLVFDIETVPDVAGGARLYGLDGLDAADTARAMQHLRQMEAGTDFLRHHLHRVVAISVLLRAGETVRVWTLGEEGADEAELLRRFFEGIERYTPVLVSWNGSGFDLPVLHYRCLLHGVSAPRYWDSGGEDSSFRWNNYLSRFHERHTDLMDVLSGHQPRANVGLDDLATLLGLPGKMGMHGSQVWERFLAGDIGSIRNYCETDVLNTYLLYLRFELMRGRLDGAAHAGECSLLEAALVADGRPHLLAFRDAWRRPAGPA